MGCPGRDLRRLVSLYGLNWDSIRGHEHRKVLSCSSMSSSSSSSSSCLCLENALFFANYPGFSPSSLTSPLLAYQDGVASLDGELQSRCRSPTRNPISSLSR